jgi:hypothetical protein
LAVPKTGSEISFPGVASDAAATEAAGSLRPTAAASPAQRLAGADPRAFGEGWDAGCLGPAAGGTTGLSADRVRADSVAAAAAVPAAKENAEENKTRAQSPR